MTDAAQQTFQHRIADLLDDVTETAAAESAAAESAAAEVAVAEVAAAEVAAKAPAPPAPPVESPPAQAAATQTATQAAAAPLPPAEEIPSLPPFLVQTAATRNAAPADGRSLPGTSLFVNPSLRPAAKADLPPQAPPATGSATSPANGQQAPLPAGEAAGETGGETGGETAATLETAVLPTALELERTPVAASAAALVPNISIRGRSDGLVVEIGKGSWGEILTALDERLQQSASFFRNAQVAVDLGVRVANEAELAPLLDLLRRHGLTPGALRTSSERTFQAALALGQTTTLESAEGVAMADAATAATNATAGAYFVYRGYLRSGHRLQRSESVLVIGDINPGAEVSSEGDVLVWGRLRGVVHAGLGGNTRAIVAALDLEPTQLRIAHVMTVGPDPRPGQPGKWFWRRSANKRPEIARIVNEEIALEEWDTGRPGGLVSLRRGG